MNGFQSPNYTQTPNDLFDELLPVMGLAELKVVMCIVRHTFGYHKEEVKLSIRAIARFTGLTAKSVMEGAEQAEGHGLIERHMDGNKTTTWTAIVSVIPTTTPRDTKYHAGVIPTTTQLGVKESKKKESNKHRDIIDGMIEMANFPGAKKQVRIDAISGIIGKTLHVNSETKTWQNFAKFAEERQRLHGEEIQTFLKWLQSQKGYDLQYWPPAKMMEHWPRAFAVQTASLSTISEDERARKIAIAAQLVGGSS